MEKVWARRGPANENTTISFSDGRFPSREKPLAAGDVRIAHHFPTKDQWTIIFLEEFDFPGGSFSYDDEKGGRTARDREETACG